MRKDVHVCSDPWRINTVLLIIRMCPVNLGQCSLRLPISHLWNLINRCARRRVTPPLQSQFSSLQQKLPSNPPLSLPEPPLANVCEVMARYTSFTVTHKETTASPSLGQDFKQRILIDTKRY